MSIDLHATTDAAVWAAEYKRMWPMGCTDEAIMLAWFAGAIETGRSAGAAAEQDRKNTIDILLVEIEELRDQLRAEGMGKSW